MGTIWVQQKFNHINDTQKSYQNDAVCKREITTFIRKIEPEKEFE